ncbi:enoyl-CoA hydratase-related protein [Amycolatopsis acidiphila]|uniref:1,4-dihydroxy-6-naphthoate synthase n=2 Tax=Amycolatopsis acidiphila TaxID=715473 RepID=A0A558AI08_9PSEU|nr:enoyl-CoA hydratase-related protein [Amycolatopsis acidiphila]TVT23904.1 1,4-dihydroxy-6-naphthoate synthase [Amycolatopsis acidiphila]UIJ61119.1 enoyl-CoA hydratase-related protein [Amycolatopsis acidiphila]GHG86633.1 1,4-dihydroxy-2-naphthoyl-CoA synthase [Amycolatopsis acidiphila]
MSLEPDKYADVLYEVKDSIARVVINRPERLNAFTPHTVRELTLAVRRAGADSEVGVIVLTGAGDRAFSAGGDVSVESEDTFRAGDESFDELMKKLYRAFRECLKPVIARVDGYAIGGGHHMAYFCDFTIASERSIFGQNGPRVASPAEGWLVSHLWTVVGMKRAKEIWMLCRRYSAQQALDWGLVNAVVPPEQLDAEVAKWAQEMLALSPTVLKLVKKSFDDSVAAIRESQDRFDILNQVNPGFFASGEQTEGAEAFMEKRTPDFSPWR